MTAPAANPAVTTREVPFAVLLAGLLALFSLGTTVPWYLGLGVSAGVVAAATWIRARVPDPGREVAGVLVLGAFVVLAASAAPTPGPILLGGAASLALLVWYAEDPRETPGGALRAAPSLLIAVFVLSVGTVSAFFLPSRNAVVGIAAGLFVFSIVLLSVFFGRPDLLDRNRAANP